MYAILRELLQRVEELERRASQMVVRGRIAEVDCKNQRARVNYGTATKPQLTDWLRWKPMRSGKAIVWWAPEVGEGVTVLADGDLSLGEILPGSYQNDFPAPSSDPDLFLVQFGDGAELCYHRGKHALTATLPEAGTTVLTAKGGITLIGDTTIEGRLHASGNISSDGDVSDSARSMRDDRSIYNGHEHPADPNVPPTNDIQ